MNQEKYMKSIIKKIKCSSQKKREIKKELEANIQIALQNGESLETIKDRMGTPLSVATEFNENFSKAEVTACRNAKRIKVVSLILVIIGIGVLGAFWMLPKTDVIDGNSMFDEKVVISQAEIVIGLLNENDYETIKERYANQKMKTVLDVSTMSEAKLQIGDDWGEFKSYTIENTAEINQMGKKFAVVQIAALYENRSVTYTISFDEDMLLAGLYMK